MYEQELNNLLENLEELELEELEGEEQKCPQEILEFERKEMEREDELLRFLTEMMDDEQIYTYRKTSRRHTRELYFTENVLATSTNAFFGRQPTKYPLTLQSKLLWKAGERLNTIIERKKKKRVLNSQLKAISTIRDKIFELRRHFLCLKEARALRKKRKLEAALSEMQYFHNLNLWDHPKRFLIAFKYLCNKSSVKKFADLQRRNNETAIVRKILLEKKRKESTRKKDNKWKEKTVKGLEVVGTSLKLYEIELVDAKVDAIEETVEEEEEPKKEAVVDVVKSKSKKKDKNTNTKDVDLKKHKRKDDKKSKKSEEKKNKKCAKKLVEELKELTIPFVPRTNQRQVISGDDVGRLEELLSDLRSSETVIKTQVADFEHKKLLYKVHEFPPEHTFNWHPNVLIFREFKKNRIYRKKLILVNAHPSTKKCAFQTLKTSEILDPCLIRVEPIGVHKVLPGQKINLIVTFVPKHLDKTVEGLLEFKSYTKDGKYGRFEIPFTCIPMADVAVQIIPKNVIFQPIYFWETEGNNNFRTIKVKNCGAKKCLVTIRKIPIIEDVDLESFVSSTESDDPTTLIKECVENTLNYFQLDSYFLKLTPSEEKQIKVRFKNVDYAGDFIDRYCFSVCETVNSAVAIEQEVLIVGETLASFLQVEPTILDFKNVNYGHLYQLNICLTNTDKGSHGIVVQFPSDIKDSFISSNLSMFVTSRSSKIIPIKFLPKKHLFHDSSPFFDKDTGILEFPIKIRELTKKYAEMPPLTITVYAILSSPLTIYLAPEEQVHATLNEKGELILDLGCCSLYETVYTELRISNESLKVEHHVFVDLPSAVQIYPKYGFAAINPQESKTVTLYFSPEVKDIPNYEKDNEYNNCTVQYKIFIDSLNNRGQIKQDINYKKIKRSLESIDKQIRPSLVSSLEEDMLRCVKLFSNCEEFQVETIATEDPSVTLNEQLNLEPATSTSETSPSHHTSLWIRATITQPLFEFAHQYLRFPDTPSGSYSLLSTEIRWMKRETSECDFMYKRKQKKGMYENVEASFVISSDNGQIYAEPSCGTIKNGEVIKITFVAKPEFPKEVVEENARNLKIAELTEMKREEFRAKRLKELEHKRLNNELKLKKLEAGKKGAKGSSKKKSKLEEPAKSVEIDVTALTPKEEEIDIPEIVIDENLIKLDYLDQYPSEIDLCTKMEPYTLQGNFKCSFTYPNKMREVDNIFLTAECLVVKPDFIHDMRSQLLDFGNVAIGVAERKVITIRNITAETITVEMSTLNPIGSFHCSNSGYILDPNVHFSLPIIFRPENTDTSIQFMEIKSRRTICPFVLRGTGLVPDISIAPDFRVCRIQALKGEYTEVAFEVRNKSEGIIPITIRKVVELEGDIHPLQKAEELPKTKGKKGKTPEHKTKASEKSSKTEKKLIKFSNELTEDEIESLKTNFSNNTGLNYFQIAPNAGNSDLIEIESNNKKSIKIRFGIKIDSPNEKGATKSKKGKKGTGSDSSSNKLKEKGGNKKGKDDSKGVTHCYVAKYNMFIGNATFLSDIILLGTFV